MRCHVRGHSRRFLSLPEANWLPDWSWYKTVRPGLRGCRTGAPHDLGFQTAPPQHAWRPNKVPCTELGESRARTDIDDSSVTLRSHVREYCLCRAQYAEYVGIKQRRGLCD